METASPRTHPNAGRMVVYGLLAECLLIVPILIPLYLSRGLSATDVFLVQAVFTVGVFVFEVPSGYFADVLGRRRTLVLAALFWMCGFSAYALARSLPGFLLAELLLALGASLRSGADAALVFDSLKEIGAEAEFGRYQGRVDFASRIGTAVASVAGGLLGGVLLELPVYLNIATAALMLLTALGFTEPRRSRPPYENPLKGIGRVVARCAGDARLFLPMLLSAVMTSVGIVGIWAYLLLFQKSGLSSAASGVLFAIFQVASGLGARRSAQIERRLGARRAAALFPLVGVGLLAVALWPRVAVCAAAMVVNGFVWGLSGPLLMVRINERASSEVRATVISVGSMTGRLLYLLLAPAVGRLADAVSLASGFALLGTTALIGSALLLALYGPQLEAAAIAPGVQPPAGSETPAE